MNDTTQPPVPAQAQPAKKLFWGGAALSFLLSFALYVKTMAASASFWDSGEFIAAAYRLGIPHSPGTPLYILVGKVFTLLPLPFFSIAERVNLLSAFCGAAGILFVYLLIIRFLDFTMGRSETVNDALVKVAGALVGSLFLTFSDTYWNNAVEAEVYAMSNALMGFMTWLAIKWGDNPRGEKSTPLIYLLFYLLALSVGFHLGTILVFSGIFFFILMTKDRTFTTAEFLVACVGVGIFVADATIYRNGQLTVALLAVFALTVAFMYSKGSKFAAFCSLLFLLGLSVHLYLLIRSGHNPNMDEGDPETWRALYAVLRREQYPPTNVLVRKASFIFQLEHFNGYFQSQFQMASAYVSQLNLGSLFPIGLGIWGMVDQFTRNRRSFVMLFVTFVVVSLGLIVFLNFSDNEVRERDYFYSPAFYYFAIYIGIGAGSLLGELRYAVARARASVSPAVALSCLVLVATPFFTGAHNYFSHDRSNNYTCPVYARNMLIGLEKDAVIFTNGDNDTFPLWYIQDVEGYRTDVRVVNLSLLNTPWYIKQCRENYPKIDLSWTDEQIDALRPMYQDGQLILIRDIAVQEIIKSNLGKKPIYFAVTIPPSTYAPYRQYLEMEGLAYKIVRRKGENMINVTRLEKNITENYDYTSILTPDWKRDHSVYLPPHTEHLIQNYAAAFIQLAYIMHQDSLYQKAARYMEAAYEISPHLQPPRQMLGLFYIDAGYPPAKAIDFYEKELAANPGDLNIVYRLAGIYERIGDLPRAVELLDVVIAGSPNDRDLMLTAHLMAMRAGMTEKARSYLTDWLVLRPKDEGVRQRLNEFDAQLRGDAGAGQ